MRISNKQIELIIQAITPFVGSGNAELRLYGSRVHDDKKGGDIDLLLLIEHAPLADKLILKKHYIMSSLKKKLGDQKIDLLIAKSDSMKEQPFLNLIWPQSVCLKKWNILNKN